MDSFEHIGLTLFSKEYFMNTALKEAIQAGEEGEIPVGAVIVKDNKIIAKAHNRVEHLKDPTAHAEILAITQASNNLEDWRLEECSLFVTKEPCIMCAGAIRNARIKKVFIGILDEKEGACISKYDLIRDESKGYFAHIEYGILENEIKDVFNSFFKKIRN